MYFDIVTGVDDTSVITLQYPDNKWATLTISISARLNQRAVIFGTKGMIEVNI